MSEIQTIETQEAPQAIGPYSQAKVFGQIVFCSGQIPLDPKTQALVGGGIKEQTEQVCKNIQGLLKAAGTDLSKVLKSSCFLKDMNQFADFNEVYGKYFGATKPARSTVEVARLPKDVLVEIEVIATR
ncbi:MAG: regulator [Deltaproteobacteria bacterium CG11_big_fil_rev_8_21_14_0_20_45_16]|nr:MAG: regulator [Deltaproteobacteria bacterium CG11_big_fil_rev_8_21_14_0_20_45_16]